MPKLTFFAYKGEVVCEDLRSPLCLSAKVTGMTELTFIVE